MGEGEVSQAMSCLKDLCSESNLSARLSLGLQTVDIVVTSLEDFRKAYKNLRTLIWDLKPWSMNVPGHVLRVQNGFRSWHDSTLPSSHMYLSGLLSVFTTLKERNSK